MTTHTRSGDSETLHVQNLSVYPLGMSSRHLQTGTGMAVYIGRKNRTECSPPDRAWSVYWQQLTREREGN